MFRLTAAKPFAGDPLRRRAIDDPDLRTAFNPAYGNELNQASHILFGLVLGQAVAFLILTLKLLLSPIDYIEVVVGEPAPLLLGSALELLPVAFDSIPIHDTLPFFLH
jgi:hypothetical protein